MKGEKLTVKSIFSAFKVSPQLVYSLEASGRLTAAPHTSKTFIQDLARWYRDARGPLPEEARALLDRVNGGGA